MTARALEPGAAAGDRFGVDRHAGHERPRRRAAPRQARRHQHRSAYLMRHDAADARQFENPTPNPGDEFGFSVAAVGVTSSSVRRWTTPSDRRGRGVPLRRGDRRARAHVRQPRTGSERYFGWSVAAAAEPVDRRPARHDRHVGRRRRVSLQRQHRLRDPGVPEPDAVGRRRLRLRGRGRRTEVVIGAPGHDLRGRLGSGSRRHDAARSTVLPGERRAPRHDREPVAVGRGLFGRAVAALGSNLLVGAPVINGSAVSSGAAYLFNGTTGTVTQHVLQPDPDVERRVRHLARSGRHRQGRGRRPARRRVSVQPEHGSAFLFHAASGSTCRRSPSRRRSARISSAAAIAAIGSYIVVGAPLDDTVEVDAGAVYFFRDTSCGNAERSVRASSATTATS